MRRETAVIGGILMLAGCGRAVDNRTSSDNAQPTANAVAPTIPAPGTGPDAHTPFAPVRLAVDPKSGEGARQVAERFASLVDQRRFAEAQKLWDNQQTAADFMRGSANSPKMHFGNIGPPQDEEGAAGSVYVTIPAVLWTRDAQSGIEERSAVSIVLCRSNDVPGSTAEERQWRIHDVMMPPRP